MTPAPPAAKRPGATEETVQLDTPPGLLHVLLIEEDTGKLNIIGEWLDACRAQFAFAFPPESRLLLSNATTTLRASVADAAPLLVFIEAPANEVDEIVKGDDLWSVLAELQQLSQHRFVRAFVLSTRDYCFSLEAQNAWMNYDVVVGYEQLFRPHAEEDGETTAPRPKLSLDDLRDVLGEMIATLARNHPADKTANRKPVGSRLRVPDDDYQKHKFVSFITGGVSNTLIRLRQIKNVVQQADPVFKFTKGDKLQYQYSGGASFVNHPFAESAQAYFSDLVAELYGKKPSGKAEADWNTLCEQAESRQRAPHMLILGETGTGKTMLAKWLHHARFNWEQGTNSQRRVVDELFQDLNCGAISPNLIDSELFGALAGAYTSHTDNSPGSIFCACMGTLFLDEIGELPLQTQAVLLKYLDDGFYAPVGAHGKRIRVPTLVIAATNRPLEALVQQGTFRHDLYQRFRLRLRLPSLKERAAYLPELIDFVLQNPTINPRRHETNQREANRKARNVNYLHKAALQLLRRYNWPGNFRELEQVLADAVAQAAQEGNDTLMAHHIRFTEAPPD